MRIARRLLCALALIAAGGLSLQAQAQPQPRLRFCAEDENSYPWMLKERPGLNAIMMKLLGEQLGLVIDVERQPWRRCLLSMRDGLVDGAFKSSFNPERLSFGHYPMREGKPDLQRRMLDESYHLYRRKGSRVQWDGRLLFGLEGPIGAQAGFSIVESLRAAGHAVDDGTKVPEALLAKLRLQRVGAAALQTQQGDFLLEQQPELDALIERIGPPLVSKPYYLMLSPQLVARDPTLAERIWDGVATVRESAAYKNAAAGFR